MNIGGEEFRVEYVPGESNTFMFGGNSNWRGPIWLCSECIQCVICRLFFSVFWGGASYMAVCLICVSIRYVIS